MCYLICTTKPTTFDKVDAMRSAVQYGHLTAPTETFTVHATASSHEMALKLGQVVADHLRTEVTLRYAYLACGTHFHSEWVYPTPLPEQGETAEEEWEPYDGVPADTGSI